MCYLLRVASPLTLSEVRSMLPADLGADARDQRELAQFQAHLPDVQTVVALLHGACSCDLVTVRAATAEEDDAELRRSYRERKATRTALLRALQRHERGRRLRRHPAGHWTEALHRFIAEHARNAGPSLVHLAWTADFDAAPRLPARMGTVSLAHHHRRGWLIPDRLIRILP